MPPKTGTLKKEVEAMTAVNLEEEVKKAVDPGGTIAESLKPPEMPDVPAIGGEPPASPPPAETASTPPAAQSSPPPSPPSSGAAPETPAEHAPASAAGPGHAP